MRAPRAALARAWTALLAQALLLVGCGRAPPIAGEAVPGGDGGGLPRAAATAEGFDSAALEASAALAQAQGARALLVMRHGHLVLEHYWHMQPGELVAGGDMGEAALAIAAGVAVRDLGIAPVGGALQPAPLVAAIERESHGRYATWLSRSVWQPLNAAPAVLAGDAASGARGCCLAARAGDWLRLAGLLLDGGRFEGTQVVDAGWVAAMRAPLAADPGRAYGLWLAPAASGAEPFAAPGVAFLRGPSGTRLWVVPQLDLAVLLVARGEADGASDGAPGAPDETRVPNAVVRALREQRPAQTQGLHAIVPGH